MLGFSLSETVSRWLVVLGAVVALAGSASAQCYFFVGECTTIFNPTGEAVVWYAVAGDPPAIIDSGTMPPAAGGVPGSDQVCIPNVPELCNTTMLFCTEAGCTEWEICCS